MAITLDGTSGITSPTYAGTVTAEYSVPVTAFKNRIINGAMNVWQRGTSFTASNTILYYADRWSSTQYAGSTASITQQASGLTGVSYCMRCQRAAGQTYTATVNMSQSVETQNSLDLAGNAVTFSFWARAGSNFSASSNILVSSIITGTGTDQNVFSTYTGSNRTDQNNTLTTSWQRFSMTITVPSNATEIAVLFNYAPTGTAGANDYFEFTLAQLEKGSTATSFDYRPYGTELQLCQRYFATTGRDAAGYSYIGSGFFFNSTSGHIYWQFPVTMRAYPNSFGYIGTLSNFQALYTGGQVVATAISPTEASSSAIRVDYTISGVTAGQGFIGRIATTGSTFLYASAEL